MVVCRMASVFSVWLEAQALIPDPSALTHLGISLWAYLLLFSVIAAVAVAQLFQACAGWSCCSSLSIQTIWGHLPRKAFYACHPGAGFHQQTLPNSSCAALCFPSCWEKCKILGSEYLLIKSKLEIQTAPLNKSMIFSRTSVCAGRAFTSCWSWQPDCVAKVRVICEVGRRNSDFKCGLTMSRKESETMRDGDRRRLCPE